MMLAMDLTTASDPPRPEAMETGETTSEASSGRYPSSFFDHIFDLVSLISS